MIRVLCWLLLGLALGIYGFSQALLQIPFGYLSDRFGRRRLIALGLVSLLWLFRQHIHRHIIKPLLRCSRWAYHSGIFRQLLLYGVPYVLILLYALHEIKSDHTGFYGFLLLEVFAVYVVIFWIPLIAVRFLKSFRSRPGDDQ